MKCECLFVIRQQCAFLCVVERERERKKECGSKEQNLVCESHCCDCPLFLSLFVCLYNSFLVIAIFCCSISFLFLRSILDGALVCFVRKKMFSPLQIPPEAQISWTIRMNRDQVYLIINYNFRERTIFYNGFGRNIVKQPKIPRLIFINKKR